MKFNVYIKTPFGRGNPYQIAEHQVNSLVEAYKLGKDSTTISGKKYSLKGVQELKIFTDERGWTRDNFRKYVLMEDLQEKSGGEIYFPPAALEKIGDDVTDKFLGDTEFGQDSIKIPTSKNGDEFISEARIKELKGISSSKFDLSKLLQLCEEINNSYALENYLSVGMIGRTIINHVPPIFGFNTFTEVANNYAGHGKSFRKSMNTLNESLKNIADRFLHDPIRSKETLPHKPQVNFSHDMDVLLQEIVRILK